MLANDYSFIFIQPPKTATTSIRKWLIDRGLVPSDGGPFKRHSRAIDIKKAIEGSIWNKALKFAVLRCPYDRLVSYYLYCVKLATNPSKAVIGTNHTRQSASWISKCNNFSEFVDLIFKDEKLYDYITRSTQHAFYGNCVSEMRILNMNTLDLDFKLLCREAGWKYEPLYKHNTSLNRQDVWSYYDEATKDKVYNLLRQDIILYNKYNS